MDEVRRVQALARISRRNDYNLPVVETPEDALRLAQSIADSLAAARRGDRALLLSDIVGLELALRRRLRRLEQDLGEAGVELRRLNEARRARLAYGRGGRKPCR